MARFIDTHLYYTLLISVIVDRRNESIYTKYNTVNVGLSRRTRNKILKNASGPYHAVWNVSKISVHFCFSTFKVSVLQALNVNVYPTRLYNKCIKNFFYRSIKINKTKTAV